MPIVTQIVVTPQVSARLLTKYLTRLQSLLSDPTNQFWSQASLINYINEARGQVAAEGQCVKVLPSGLNTVANQEVYTFASANQFAQLIDGVSSILFVESVAVSWGALKPVLDQWNWNDLQARVRAYPIISGQPAMWAQFGQGQGGSIYLQPVPTQALAMEWNCVCTPIDLAVDADPEAIPYPWTDAVPYYAAYLAFLNARRPGEATDKFRMFEVAMTRARAFSESSMVPSYYN